MTAAIKMYAVTIACALTALGIWAFVVHERQVGARDVLLAQSAARIDTLEKQLVRERQTFHIDTIRLTRLVTRWDSVIVPLRDTITRYRTDTVRISVRTLALIDTTIATCRKTVADCTRLANTERDRADALETQTRILRAQMPSRAGNALRAALWGGAGLLVGKMVWNTGR